MGEIKGIAEGILRIIATVVGLIGTVIAFFAVTLNTMIQDSKHGFGSGHFFLGLLVTLAALIGALASFPAPTFAAVLMVLAAIGLIFLIKGAALILGVLAIIFLVIAAILAFMDRKKAKAATAR